MRSDAHQESSLTDSENVARCRPFELCSTRRPSKSCLPLLHERILDITSERLFHEQCAFFARSDERPRENYVVNQYTMLLYNNHDNNQTSPIQYRLIGPFQIKNIVDGACTVRSTADSAVSEVPVYRLVPFTHASSIAETSLILATELNEDCVISVTPDPDSNNFRVRWLMAPP
jgi:hypothetical protein